MHFLFFIPFVALAISVVTTLAVRKLATINGFVSQPRSDRWKQQPVALLGGVAIFAATLITWAFTGLWTKELMLIFAGGTVLFVAGLVDDFANLKPYQKLIAQVVATSLVLASGLVLPWTAFDGINLAITFVWLIGLTNAINLLDNMDGLAAGIGMIASCFLAIPFLNAEQYAAAILLLSFAAVLLGFLVFNWNPASIFMGDCGSMFIGFFLASMSLLLVSGARFRTFLPIISVPVLTMLVPIFDTSVVTLVRKLAGRSISTGGRDHTSHRLVALGLSERKAVGLLYVFAALAGVLGLAVRHLPIAQSIAAVLGFIIGLVLLGVYLGRVQVYEDSEIQAAREQPVIGFLINISHKQRVFEVLLDLVLIGLAFQLAVMIHSGLTTSDGWMPFAPLMLVLASVKLLVFLPTGIYRELWQYVSVHSALVMIRAVLISSTVCAGVVLVSRTLNVVPMSGVFVVPLSVIFIDSCLLLVLLLASRMAFRLFKQWLVVNRNCLPRKRTLIYGAGDAGDLLCRELQQNLRREFEPIGFVDDDPHKRGKQLHGLPVFEGNGSLSSLLQEHNVEELIVSSVKVCESRIDEISDICQDQCVRMRRFRFAIDDVGEINIPAEESVPKQ